MKDKTNQKHKEEPQKLPDAREITSALSTMPVKSIQKETIKDKKTDIVHVTKADEKADIKDKKPAKKDEGSSKDNIPLDAKWYVIHTYSGHENKVAATLKQRVETMKLERSIFDIIVPTRSVVVVRHGKKETQKEKIFPGYILVKMVLDDVSWLAVRTTPGVTGFVGMGTKPIPISEKEVETILTFMKMEAPKYKAKFTSGEAVKIVDGPFADFLGSIESIDEGKGKVRVLVSIFGRETPVELDFLQIAKL